MLELIVIWLIVNTVIALVALARSRRETDVMLKWDLKALEDKARVLDYRLNTVSSKVDSLSKQVAGVAELERRCARLEREVRGLQAELKQTLDSVLRAYDELLRQLGSPLAEVDSILPLLPRGKKLLLIDGSNVARLSPGAKPTVKNLLLAVDWALKQGFHPVILIERAVLRGLDDQQVARLLRKQGYLYAVRPPFEADEVLLELADRLGAPIFSNDSYSEYRQRYPWIDERRYAFVVDQNRLHVFKPGELPGG